MQARLDRIDALISSGYTLERKYGYYPDLKKSSGESVNIFGGLFSLSGPAGFSWIAFFFPWAVCAQIKEWSFFYFVAVFSFFSTALSIWLGTNTNVASFLTCFFYASMYPYLRYLAAKGNVKEYSKAASIVIGILLWILAIVPSFILAFISAALF